MKEPEYISLREAAEISGYSADYVGQLIRQGKIPGKQVPSSVAWMTTAPAVRSYVEQRSKGGTRNTTISVLRERLASPEWIIFAYRSLLWGAIAITTLVFLASAFLLFVGIDHVLERKSLETSYGS